MNENNKNRRIIIIDDNEKIHDDIKAILTTTQNDNESLNQARSALFGENKKDTGPIFHYEIDSAFQGQNGYQLVKNAVEQNTPYALAFVDMRMPPGWDGIETIKHLWQVAPNLQVLICSAYSDYSWQETVQELGQTDKMLILKKPFDATEIRQAALAMTEKYNLVKTLDQLVEQRTEQVYTTQDAAVFALANLAESRDPETGEHLIRLRSYCDIIAKHLKDNSPYASQIDKQFIHDLYRSSPLHDIGKVGIPDSILLKPGDLSDREFNLMKEHVAIGARALEKTIHDIPGGSFLQMAVDIARYHHERFNGNGYLQSLAGQDIPLSARIVAIADVYDALTSIRVYKAAFQPEVAKAMILDQRGEHFDPVIVDAFIETYDQLYDIAVNREPEPITA